MKLTNGVLILGPKDLNLNGRKKRTKNVEPTDIAWSLDPYKQAAIVLFVNDEKNEMKVLKSRYKII